MKKFDGDLYSLKTGQILYNQEHGIYWVGKIWDSSSSTENHRDVNIMSLDAMSTCDFIDFADSQLNDTENTYIFCNTTELRKAIKKKFK